MKRLIACLLSTLLLVAHLSGCSTPTAASRPAEAPAPSPQSMLWIGNSFYYYNNSMHGHVGKLLQEAGLQGRQNVSATISGSGLNWHDVAAHFKPGGIASYSFVGDNEVRFNTRDRLFDAVLMMDCSQCPVHPELSRVFFEYARKHSTTAREHGAAPMFFMSWAYADKPEMTEALASAYVWAGQENRALVVPAGLAFAASVRERPDIHLIIADKRHPTLEGTYLAASTILASVYRTSPVGNRYTAGLPPDVAAHLQRTAWETAQVFHAAHGRGQ